VEQKLNSGMREIDRHGATQLMRCHASRLDINQRRLCLCQSNRDVGHLIKPNCALPPKLCLSIRVGLLAIIIAAPDKSIFSHRHAKS
jgi:hypothetical protein